MISARGPIVLLAALTIASVSAYADPIYGTSADLTGTRTESGLGVVTGGDYLTDALNQTVAWNIINLGVSSWSYEYTLTNFSSPNVSHFILDLTDDCVDPGDAGCVGGPNGIVEFNDFGPHPSNPGFPVGMEIVGVKFDFGGESPFVYSFMSNRPPVWGDFYTKGGNDSFAYNPGLTMPLSETPNDFIARPNGDPGDFSEIPEPTSITLMGTGLLALGLFARRRVPRRDQTPSPSN